MKFTCSVTILSLLIVIITSFTLGSRKKSLKDKYKKAWSCRKDNKWLKIPKWVKTQLPRKLLISEHHMLFFFFFHGKKNNIYKPWQCNLQSCSISWKYSWRDVFHFQLENHLQTLSIETEGIHRNPAKRHFQ